MPLLLGVALEKERGQEGQWAFTETQETCNRKGKVTESVVVRHDPSKPYAEQYTPLSVDGQPPSNKIIKEYRERGEQEARVRHQLHEQKGDESEAESPKIDLGSEKGKLNLALASVADETDLTVTYKIPVTGEKSSRFPFDKLQVLILVQKESATLEELRLSVLSPFRMKLIAKVKSVEVGARYTTVDAAHPPQVTSVDIDAKVSVFFTNADQLVRIRRSDFKRVKPYDERFTVKSGPLKTLGF
jgi:hypothetical protein